MWSPSSARGIQHDIYRPLRTALFSLEWHLFGTSPRPWHAVSLLLHVLATLLVFRLLWGFVGSTYARWSRIFAATVGVLR